MVCETLSRCVALSGQRLGAANAARQAQRLATDMGVPFVHELPAPDSFSREQGVCEQTGRVQLRIAQPDSTSSVLCTFDWGTIVRDAMQHVAGRFPFASPTGVTTKATIQQFVERQKLQSRAGRVPFSWHDWSLWQLADTPARLLAAPVVQSTAAQRDTWGDIQCTSITPEGKELLQGVFDEALQELYQRCVHQLQADMSQCTQTALHYAAQCLAAENQHTAQSYTASQGKGYLDRFSGAALTAATGAVWGSLMAGMQHCCTAGAGGNPGRSGAAIPEASLHTFAFTADRALPEIQAELQTLDSALEVWPQLAPHVLGVLGVLHHACSIQGPARVAVRDNLLGCIFPCLPALLDFVEVACSAFMDEHEQHAAASEETVLDHEKAEKEKEKQKQAAAQDVRAVIPAASAGAAAGAHAAAEEAQQVRRQWRQEQPQLWTEMQLRALEQVPGKALLDSDTLLSAAALPVHALSLPQPSSVKAALGLPTEVKRGSTALTPMPPPMANCALFTHRGSVYLLGGMSQRLPVQDLHGPLPELARSSTELRGLEVPKAALEFMGIRDIACVLDENLLPIPMLSIILPHMGRLAAATPAVRKCIQGAHALLTQAVTVAPENSKADGLIRLFRFYQSCTDVSCTSSARLAPHRGLYRLEVSGSNFKYQSLLMDEQLPQDKRLALQHLAMQARGHGQAAEWVSVPAISYGLVCWDHCLAVPLANKNDPRVVLIGGSGHGQWMVSTMTIKSAGAGLDKPLSMSERISRAPGMTAVKLVGEPAIVMYGGQGCSGTGLQFCLVHDSGCQVWSPGLYDVFGCAPSPPLTGHGAVMMRNGNMVVWGGTLGGAKGNNDVYVATILGSKAASGSPLVRAPDAENRVLWTKAAVSAGSYGPPSGRLSANMQKLPGSDSFVVFGGQSRSGSSMCQPLVCTLRSAGPVDQALLQQILSSHSKQAAKKSSDDSELAVFEAKWRLLRVADSIQSRPDTVHTPWSSPRHAAAATMLHGRLLVFGGLYHDRGTITGIPALTEFPFEKDFSTVLKSSQYSSTATRIQGGNGVHRWGVPSVVQTALGGMRGDVQVVKLIPDSIRLVASSMDVDLHWLWAGVHQAQVAFAAEQWSITPGNVQHGAQSGGTIRDIQEETGADDARLSSAAVADVVLRCGPAKSSDWPADKTSLAAHRCILAATIPFLNLHFLQLESALSGSQWALEEEDSSLAHQLAVPPPPPPLTAAGAGAEALTFGTNTADHDDDADSAYDALPASAPQLTLQRSMSVGAESVRPPLAQPACSPQCALEVDLTFVPVDAMEHILQFVYTGGARIPGHLLPSVWAACQVLGMAPSAKAVMKAARVHRSAAQSKRGVTSKTVFEPRSKKWRHSALFAHGRHALAEPERATDPTDFAACELPLVAVDTKLSTACEEQLRIRRDTDGSSCLYCSVSHVSVGSSTRGLNRSTVAGLRWLQSENAFGDILVQVQLPEDEDRGGGGEGDLFGLLEQPRGPQPAFLRAHAAVLAARSKLWRGQLCSEHFHQEERVVSLGAYEGVQLSLEDASTVLEFVYGDALKGIPVDLTPMILPLASQHSMGRLVSYCERTMVHAYDLDELSSAMGMWFYGNNLGVAGARLARIALAAIRDGAPSPSLVKSALAQFVDAGEVDEADAANFLASL